MARYGHYPFPFVPAKAGTQRWVPAFAGNERNLWLRTVKGRYA
jgi:hypothetical protein